MKSRLQLCLAVLIPFLNLTASAAVRYVSATSSSPTAPYATWETAASTIQDAIDAASAGDEIVVTNGVYATGGRAMYGTMTNRVAIDKVVTVRSVNGPDLTFIVGQGVGGASNTNGDGAIRCVYVGTNAVLSGFTLTNGHTLMTGDSIWGQGAAGALCDYTAKVTNCIFTGNWANNCGGAVYSGTLYNCILAGNIAGPPGGGFYIGIGGGAFQSVLNNCVLTRNFAHWTGGAANYSTLNNCTLTGNASGYAAGGVGDSALNNCILYYNSSSVHPNYYNSTNAYTCTTPLPPGTGNIDYEPLLTSRSHLSSQSPCIGRGSAMFASGVDIDGEAWANPLCMGADQFVPIATKEITVSIAAAYTNVAVGFGVSFVAENSGPVTTLVWDFGDGVLVTNRAFTSHTWDAPGLYPVRLTGYNNNYPGGLTATVFVQITAREVYYVNAANPTPVFPYTTWAAAANNIQDAIDASTQIGRLVRVTNGVYATGGRALVGIMTNRVVVPEGVELRSESGPSLTIIAGQPAPGTQTNGDGAVRCVYVGSNSVLSGFTLTNGHTRIAGEFGREGSGGGVWAERTSLITNCIITGNSARAYGGGVRGDRVFNCLMISNSAAVNGGGASLSVVYNCSFIGNTANSQGGGSESCTVNNSVFTGNSAGGSGGGAWGGLYYAILNNCTLTANSAPRGGGVISAAPKNCIIYFNTAEDGPNYFSSTNTYNCTTPLPLGEGNIDADPLLASASHLFAQSPCIGRGSPAYSSGLDIDGEAWLNPPCIGADQFVAGAATGELSVRITADYTNVLPGFTINLASYVSGRQSAGTWDFGGGVVVSNRPFITYSWAAPGIYPVRFTAYNDSYPGGVSTTILVRVALQDVHYVNAANANPVFPYTSWAGAATTIQDAIDAGTQPGRLVRVTNGFYSTGGRAVAGTMTNRVVVPDNVEVRSENGPQFTFIAGQPAPGATNGGGAIRCVYLGVNAVLSGFTLTNGHTCASGDLFTEKCGGGAWCANGVLKNCVLSGNSADSYGGGVFGGTLNNCVIAGNTGTYGGGAYNSWMNNCTIVGNSASYGGGTCNGGMTNSIAYHNTAYGYSNYYGSICEYSCVWPKPSGNGNITNPPPLVAELPIIEQLFNTP